MIRVVVADDHAIVRAGVRALLGTEENIEVVGEAVDGTSAVACAAQHLPDVLLLDLSMPGLNGVEAISRIRRAALRTRILVLSMHGSAEYVRPALKAGAHGYVVKGAGLEDLVLAVRTVAAGNSFLGPQAQHALGVEPGAVDAGGDRLAQLTSREKEVLQLVAEGHTNRAIAQRLELSVKTVESHRGTLMRKVGVHDAQGLTRFALRCGLVGVD